MLSRTLRVVSIFAALSAGGPAVARAAPAFTQTGESMLADSAHASDGTDFALRRNAPPKFLGPLGAKLTSYKGYQYAIYYTGKDRSLPRDKQSADVIIARRKLADDAGGTNGEWQRLTLRNYKVTSEDLHNRAEIAVSEGDGVIHLAFDHHGGKEVHYARTKPGVADHPGDVVWDASVFTYTPNLGITDLPKDIQATYPTFTAFPGGNLILYYRYGGSGNGSMRLTKYDSTTHSWGPLRDISTNEGTYLGVKDVRGPYLSTGMLATKDGVLKMSWVFRERMGAPAGVPNKRDVYANHGLYFATSPDQGITWFNNAGKLVADTGEGQMIGIDNISPPVVDIPRELGPSNPSNAAAIDEKTGEFHVMIDHGVEPGSAARRVYHYVGHPDGKWTGKASDFSASGVSLQFAGDALYAFGGRNDSDVYVAHRADGFDQWTPLPVVDAKGKSLDLPAGGFATWDLSRLDAGLATLSFQDPPANGKAGDPSPIRVMDFRINGD